MMLISITIFLFIFPHASSLSFNFTSFNSTDKTIIYEGSATLEKSVIYLTTTQKGFNKTGRATYYQPLHLWDKTTNNLIDFTTHFSFKIDSQNSSKYGDGIAFFLADSGSKIPYVTQGGTMGLALDDQFFISINNPFVAVEFDVHQNPWDPPKEHVGVDISSMRSVSDVTWFSNIKEGKLNEVWISYNSSSRNMSVMFTGFKNESGKILQQHLSAIVDLRLHLPEWVTFGFSAATGNASAIQSLYSWDFSSTMDENLKLAHSGKNTKIGLAVGLSTGGFVLGCLALISFAFWKKWKKNETDNDHEFDEYMNEDFARGAGPKKYAYAELASAANYFKDEKLGQGGFGVHRDIKSSNIMLDSNFNAKLGDFGLARLVDHAKGSQTTTALVGTRGYMAPEYLNSYRASKQSDVYSFGIVALEIACGRKAIDPMAPEDEMIMLEWVWGLYGSGRVLQGADPRLCGDFEEQKMIHLMITGLWCAHPDHNNRPSIRQAIQVLNFEAPLPILPSSFPVPTYFQCPVKPSEAQNQNTSFCSSDGFVPSYDGDKLRRKIRPSFPSFSPDNNSIITYEGDANFTSPSSIQVTGNYTNRAGRATYNEPMFLWDNTTSKLTDFTTNFTFVISSSNKDFYGDGMAFFLAPAGSKLPYIHEGGAMGLTSDDQPLNSTDNPFVAVEFDIFQNGWDPPSKEHVGVDINSVRSLTNLTWLADIKGGRTNEAKISYNSSTLNLSILFTGFNNATNTTVWQHLDYIVDLRKFLPSWVTFGFSAATGGQSAIYNINSWNFTSTLEETTNITPTGKSLTGLAVGLGVGGLVLICGLALVLIVLYRRWKKKKKKKEMEEDDHELELDEYNMSEDFERGTGPKKYSYAELASATNYFKDEQKLGHGGFGDVYRGFLKDLNSDVAIKKVSECSKQGIKEFASEVRIISQLRHRNLVQLNGWCHERKELLLVYEYMPNGSLDFHLFNNQSFLTWPVRFKIAQGLASALLYLHEEWEQCVVHRDIKSSNIMLDSNFNAKLGDFGLARLVDHAKSAQTTALAGTMGYMAPESIITGRASKESDVYSFGVVALEITCGRKPINHKAPENKINMVEWVWGLYGSGRILEAVDSRLNGDFDEEQIKYLMIVGLWCTHPNHNSRPSIRQAIQVLNFEAPLPSLPSSLPVPTYLELPIMRLSSSAPSSTNANLSSNANSSAFTTTSDDVSPSVSLLKSTYASL
ncbi:L-type lectin-domain containing receptor kinase IX.1 [Senna tora]|uniref:L-type lectin-domain containing receptor kinase IX.1 n=1 Tax=Senna tora TaxID=362788 RepID=A0A834XEK6_9FABA|nr:L-type lectin-domain containing receptor kinase IX.1 [Senna tora]